MKHIRYKKEWFNPLFFIVRKELEENQKLKKVFIYGGKGSSKTFSVAQLICMYALSHGHSSMVFRKQTSRVKTTVLKTFKAACDGLNIRKGFECLERKYRTGGAEIDFQGLDQSDKVKGIEGYNYLLFDELDQFTYQDYIQSSLSHRGEGKRIMFGTWNPISEKSWVKQKIIDSTTWKEKEHPLPNKESFLQYSEDGSTLLIKTNYQDNYWAVGSPCGTYGYKDENLLNEYEKLKDIDYGQYKINVLGEWGTTKTGEEFFPNFNHGNHVTNPTYTKGAAVFLSFDQNNLPYSTCLVAQIIQGRKTKINIIDEICLAPPLNTTVDICNEFKARYKDRVKHVFYTGDFSGKSKHMGISRHAYANHYDAIDSHLKRFLHNDSRRLFINPPKDTRRLALSRILSFDSQYELHIHQRCKNLITDFEELQLAPDGSYKKEKEKGKGWERLGHCTDSCVYLINAVDRNVFIRSY